MFIKGNIVEIKAYDTLTLYEKKLLENVENDRMINYNRHAFYLDRKEEIEGIIEKVLESEGTLTDVVIDSKENMDKMNILIK